MKGLVFVTILLLTAGAGAQEAPLATHIEWTPLWQAPGPIRVPLEDKAAQTTVDIPKLNTKEGQVLCLRFQARLTTPKYAGWNNYLGLQWNGLSLDALTKDHGRRILDRHDSFVTTNPKYPEIAVVIPRGMPCFNVFFGPRNQPIELDVVTDRDEGYWYLLDIHDVPRADTNKLVIINTALKSYWNDSPPTDLALVLEDLAVGAVSGETIRTLEGARLVKREMQPGAGVPSAEDVVTITGNGGMQVTIDGEHYFIESSFSFPHAGGMGFNPFTCTPAMGGEPEWKPEILSLQDTVLIRAQSPEYTFERVIERIDRGTPASGKPTPRIRIRDRITNSTKNSCGMVVKNVVITPEIPRQALLAGQRTPTLPSATYPENPTVFVSQAKSGLGIVVENDALRLQMVRRVNDNTVEFGTERLGIPAGQTCWLQWEMYAGSPDYFDFINRVRRDWNVNFTIDGPFDFFDATQVATPEGRAAAEKMIRRKKMKLFALTPWFEYYNGWPYSRDAYNKVMKEAQAFIRSIVPGAKCLACLETNLVPVSLSFFGNTIPKEGWPIGRENGGQYGQKATPAMTACIDNSVWRDSCLRDADGNLLLDCYYVQHYKGKPALNLMVYPTLTNHRHAQMMGQIKWVLDDVGLDGVYIDQFSLAWSNDHTRYTKEKWDNTTVMIDANGHIESKVADLGLISAPARRAWVQSVLNRNKTVVCNTNAATAELEGLHAWRFMETQGYDPLAGEGPPDMPVLTKGQLDSPIGLGHSFPAGAGADFFARTVIAHLRYGLLYYYYGTDFPAEDAPGKAGAGRVSGEFGPVTHMFPFTPVELHEGWVLGQERLITCISGEFPWPYDREPRVTGFDSRGREKKPEVAVSGEKKKYRVKIKLKDWWETAVIE